MRITTTGSNRTSLLRIAQLIALGSSLALFACQDATSPDDAKPTLNAPNLITSIGNNTTPIGEMGETLVDATNWVLPSINSETIRSSMEATLQSLATHIGMNQYDLARQDVTAARDLISKLDEVDTAEVGPIGVSIDEIDGGLKRLSY